MIGYFGGLLNTYLNGYVAQVVGILSIGLVGIAMAWSTVRFTWQGLAVMRGAVGDISELFVDWIKVAFICTFALGAATFMAVAFQTAQDMQDGMANVFIKAGGVYNGAAPANVYGALDDCLKRSATVVANIWRDAGITRLDLVWASALLWLGTTVFVVVGTLVTLVSKMVLAFGMALGPICILALLFKPTAKYFDSWVSFCLSAVVIAWFSFFALGLSFFVATDLMATLNRSRAFSPGGAVNILEAAAIYDSIMITLAIVLWAAPTYAAQLTGGVAVQSGAQVMAAAATAARLMSGGGRGARGGSSGGGSIRQTLTGGGSSGARASSGSSGSGTSSSKPAYQRIADAGMAKQASRAKEDT